MATRATFRDDNELNVAVTFWQHVGRRFEIIRLTGKFYTDCPDKMNSLLPAGQNTGEVSWAALPGYLRAIFFSIMTGILTNMSSDDESDLQNYRADNK